MLPRDSRAKLVKAFGEQRTQAFEEMVELIGKSADAAGIEKKEKKSTPVTKQVDDMMAALKDGSYLTKTKDVKATAPAGPSPFAPHYMGSVPPLFGGNPATKEASQPGPFDTFVKSNQAYHQSQSNFDVTLAAAAARSRRRLWEDN